MKTPQKFYPPGNFLDQYTIEYLKWLRRDGKDDNLDDFVNELGTDGHILKQFLLLYKANESIWNLENEIREGREGNYSLDEIGRRALEIRKFNKMRISRINELNRLYGYEYRVRKIDHASE